MSEWNPEQYLKFKVQRTQPSIDLLERISERCPKNALDIGCGPGNSTAVLKKTFKNAEILGIDSSEDMIKKACADYPDIQFKQCDAVCDLSMLDHYDVIFSNACLQWIPDHEVFIPSVMSRLNDGGVFAVQIPFNADEPLMKIMDETVKEARWGFDELAVEKNSILKPEEYFDILASCSSDFDIWETVYYHKMPSVCDMVEWIKGTRLRPYLNSLGSEEAQLLEDTIVKRAEDVYSVQENGEIIFKFRRLFFTAEK